MATEVELAEILKIVRQLERVIENSLKTEREKNEEKLKKQLEAQGIELVDDFPYSDGTKPTDAFDL